MWEELLSNVLVLFKRISKSCPGFGKFSASLVTKVECFLAQKKKNRNRKGKTSKKASHKSKSKKHLTRRNSRAFFFIRETINLKGREIVLEGYTYAGINCCIRKPESVWNIVLKNWNRHPAPYKILLLAKKILRS